MVGICDANNFYISCERVFNPALNGRPAVVLSNNDRCIIARSNEAKAIGLKMGQPIYQVRDTLRTYNVALCSPNFPLYQDMSDRMQAILKRFAPTIVYSIDYQNLNIIKSRSRILFRIKCNGIRLSTSAFD
ncbi:DNA polymerase V subunit UmuC [Alistipes sp. cv1]|nr:DNA polymerase V subunit UmuC [Faecalibacterium prausnitzii]